MKPGDVEFDEQGRAICPKCKERVSEPYQHGGKVVRRHLYRKANGEKCEYGWTEGEPIARGSGVSESGVAAGLENVDAQMGKRSGRKADWRKHIAVSRDICHGKPCIKGTRIMVSIVLDYLAGGDSVDEILEQYPTLSRDDVRAAQAYAAWLAREEESHPLRTELTS
ncbi:MAG TPA: DUF433 domain-containing protein [Pirellulales bacterium]|nr:DUF433 domain-containing protein [Pirellulales bacterium]